MPTYVVSVTSGANVRPIRVRIRSAKNKSEAEAKAIAHVKSKDNHITRLMHSRDKSYRRVYAVKIEEEK